MLVKPAAPEKGADVGLTPEAVTSVPTSPLAFTGIPPCRIADTRGNGFSGQYGPPQITGGTGRNFTTTGQCGIPGGAEAVSFNFHAVNVAAAGFFLAYPAGGAFPPVALMAYNQNTPAISNSAVVPLGTGGAITAVAGVTSIDLVIDVNGYYSPQPVVNTVNALSGNVTLAAGTNISITPSGNTLTIASTGAAGGWSLAGNAGTTPGTDFLGTTDDQPLELKVNAKRVFRFEPNVFSPNVVGGFDGNSVLATAYGATVAGGGSTSAENRVTDNFGSVGGGSNNRAGNATGGTADAGWATVAGGGSNTASAPGATVAGGISNSVIGASASVGGGEQNNASGAYATVPGGRSSTAFGQYSFAAGRRAKAFHDGAFVWGASTDADVASTGVNQFIVRAPGGLWLGATSAPSIPVTDFLNTSTGAHLTTTGIWTNNSDRAAKENLEPVDRKELLVRLATLPLSTWTYRLDKGSIRHIGPMAQDFAATFGVGNDDRSIGTLDADGVALAAIQGLYELVKEKDGEIETLKARLAKLEERIR